MKITVRHLEDRDAITIKRVFVWHDGNVIMLVVDTRERADEITYCTGTHPNRNIEVWLAKADCTTIVTFTAEHPHEEMIFKDAIITQQRMDRGVRLYVFRLNLDKLECTEEINGKELYHASEKEIQADA